MTQTISATTMPTAETRSELRTIYLIRVAFSLVWVTLVLTTSRSLRSGDKLSAIAAALLVAYPLWDVAATILERRRLGRGSMDRLRAINVALSLAATVGMVIASFSTLRAALLVFGTWALVSGAGQLVVAVRRRRTLGGQWAMIVSGGLSVFAGATIAAGSGSGTSGLTRVAGYSAFGAFWFLVAAIMLSRAGQSA